jgi:hypothetical protein
VALLLIDLVVANRTVQPALYCAQPPFSLRLLPVLAPTALFSSLAWGLQSTVCTVVADSAAPRLPRRLQCTS